MHILITGQARLVKAYSGSRENYSGRERRANPVLFQRQFGGRFVDFDTEEGNGPGHFSDDFRT